VAAARALLLVGTAVVAVAAGCGGDEQTATERWADDMCSAVATWKESLVSAAESVRADASQESIRAAVDDVEQATGTLTDDLTGLGAPDTEAGAQAQELVSTLAGDLGEGADAIGQALADAEGARGVIEAVPTITEVLATMREQASSTVDQLRELDATGELSAAFEASDSCQTVQEEQ
jgi:hypothetical protein